MTKTFLLLESIKNNLKESLEISNLDLSPIVNDITEDIEFDHKEDLYILQDDIDNKIQYNSKIQNIINSLNIEDDDLDEIVIEIYNKIRNLVVKQLKDNGWNENYNSNSFDKYHLVQDNYYDLIYWLEDNNIKYEKSKSITAGLVPSLYIKVKVGNDFDGDEEYKEILRIANHYNHDYSTQGTKIYSYNDYINWETNIVPDIEQALEKYKNDK